MQFNVDPYCIKWFYLIAWFFSAPFSALVYAYYLLNLLNSLLYAETDDDDMKPVDAGGYNAVAFSYGNNEESSVHKDSDPGLGSSSFYPPFPVPVDLVIVSLCSSMFYTLFISFWPEHYYSSLLVLTLCGQMIYV